MIRCNKCNELKEDKFFQTYFHSKQNTNRTRKVCTPCFNLQKKELRLRKKINTQMIEVPIQPIIIPPVEDMTPQIELYKCTLCKELKPIDEYYVNKRGRHPGVKSSKCKPCNMKYNNERRIKVLELKGEKLKPVPYKPNTYADEYQKVNTFLIMELMGWTFDEDKKVWWKNGIKNSNKEWSFKEIPTYVSVHKKRIRKKGYTTHPAYEHINEINELLKAGYTYLYVCRHFNMSKPTLIKILKLDGKKSNQEI